MFILKKYLKNLKIFQKKFITKTAKSFMKITFLAFCKLFAYEKYLPLKIIIFIFLFFHLFRISIFVNASKKIFFYSFYFEFFEH